MDTPKPKPKKEPSRVKGTLPKDQLIKKAGDHLRQVYNVGLNNESGTGGKNARYGVVYADGSVSELGWYPCHAYMRNANGGQQVSWSVCLKNTGFLPEKAVDEYLNWVLDRKSSPWREGIPPDLGIEETSLDFMKSYGFVIHHIDKLPSNVQHQFLVATRMAKEWPGLIEAWYELLQHGFTKEFAFAYLSMFSNNSGMKFRESGFLKTKRFEFMQEDFYDYPLDTVSCDEDYILNFLKGDMVGPRNKPYAENAYYTDPYKVNGLWGKSQMNAKSSETYLNQFKDRHKGVIKEEAAQRDFGIGTYYKYFIENSDFIKTGLAEQDYLYGKIKTKKKAG